MTVLVTMHALPRALRALHRASRAIAHLDGVAEVDEHVGHAVDAADNVHAGSCHLHTTISNLSSHMGRQDVDPGAQDVLVMPSLSHSARYATFAWTGDIRNFCSAAPSVKHSRYANTLQDSGGAVPAL